MSLDVLMVTPASRVEVYQALSEKHAAIEPPVWSGLIAEYMRRHDYDVAMLDAEAESLTHEQTARRIAQADPKLIVFMVYGQQPSASTQCMAAARRTAKRVQELTDRPSVVVGTHASALPERTLRQEPYTYVCQGEGPLTVPWPHAAPRGRRAAVVGARAGLLGRRRRASQWLRAFDR
jgi:hypothetical protein